MPTPVATMKQRSHTELAELLHSTRAGSQLTTAEDHRAPRDERTHVLDALRGQIVDADAHTVEGSDDARA